MRRWTIVCLLATALPIGAADPGEVNLAITSLRNVGREGTGNADAQQAWKRLVAHGEDALPSILSSLKGASPVQANWIRSAYETIVDRELKKGAVRPEPLEGILEDARYDGRARRLAYETLVRLDPKTPERWLPKLL